MKNYIRMNRVRYQNSHNYLLILFFGLNSEEKTHNDLKERKRGRDFLFLCFAYCSSDQKKYSALGRIYHCDSFANEA